MPKQKTSDFKWIVNATCRNEKCKAKDVEVEIDGKADSIDYYSPPVGVTNRLICMHCGMMLVQTSVWRRVAIERDETPDEELARLQKETDEAAAKLSAFIKSKKANKAIIKQLLEKIAGEE